jgi:integrase
VAKGTVTQRSVEGLKGTDRDEFLWDDKLAGFGVRCLKGTGRKSFVVQWKREGRTRQIALGHYPLVKAEEARRQAVEMLAAVSRGEDPAADRDAAQSSPRVAEVCDRWVMLGVGPKGRLKRPTTLEMDRSRIDSHIRRHDIGAAKIRAVTAADVRRWLADVTDGKTAVDEKVADRRRSRRIVRGGAGVAARTLRMLKAVFAYAVRHGLIAESPARDVHAPDHAEQERERYLSPEELARLGKALSQAEESGAAWQAVGCVKLLLATGLRKDEALSLKWSDVDLERRRLVLPETKTGRSVRPLSRSAIAILTGIRGRSSDSWLFPASRGAGHFVGLQKVWVQIRSAARLGDVHLHDLRHTVGAAAASAGTSLVIVGRMLGHKKARSTERYAHVAPDVAADVADQIAEGIAHAVANGGVKE